MNLNNNPTTDQLRELIRQGDDRAGHHVFWVSQDGEVHLSMIPKGQPPVWPDREHTDMKLCTEVFLIGHEYVGDEAAEDNDWVSGLFQFLLQEWPRARDSHGVTHLDVADSIEI
jgi:hypothetical protein